MTEPCGAINKNSTCILQSNHDGRHFDANNGHSWVQTVPVPDVTETAQNDEDTHRSHCCSVHGCKYATNQEEENACPVSNGTIQQDHPCDHCDYQAEGLRQATDAQLAAELIRRGYSDAAAYLP
jgi:hypothetical protein